jgi:hypothetical protein
MHILKRPSGDNYSLRLFTNLIRSVKQPCDSFYMWSACIDPNHSRISHFVGDMQFYEDEVVYRNVLMSNIKNNLIILGIKDHLTSIDFNPWVSSKPDLVEYLDSMFNYYPDKHFVVFTSLENLDYYITNPRVTIIPWGGDLTNHKSEYEKLEPLDSKNFDSPYTYLSLNRGLRSHRAVLTSLLYGLDINDSGMISCMFKDSISDLLGYLKWEFTSEQQSIKDRMCNGFDLLRNTEIKLPTDRETNGNYPNSANGNNFKNSLIHYYRETFVEVITETSCTERCFNLTEKTLNSIYGKSFPILISSPGVVAFLRTMGMDVFDDIIDHSYDTIENPIDRIYQAVSSNIELLTNNIKTKELWKQHEHRFIKNIDFAKTRLYNFYTQRTTDTFHEFINLQN